MDENEFVIGGCVYIAVDSKNCDGEGCVGCAMDERRICPPFAKSDNVPECHASLRKDGRTVIFVEKQQ